MSKRKQPITSILAHNDFQEINLLRLALINKGIENLISYGYTQVDKDNILTDHVYSAFFSSMLNDEFGHHKLIDAAISELQTEIKKPK